MLIDIPAVADTDGTFETITWRSDGIYTAGGAISDQDLFFIYIDPPSQVPYLLGKNAQNFTISGTTVTMAARKNPPQGSTIRFLTTVAPTFRVPINCKSWTLRNVSGAVLYFRQYRPNLEANVIDTVASTFGEDDIVGQQLADGLPVAFGVGDFTPGTAWMLCATAAASNGAIVEFNF